MCLSRSTRIVVRPEIERESSLIVYDIAIIVPLSVGRGKPCEVALGHPTAAGALWGKSASTTRDLLLKSFLFSATILSVPKWCGATGSVAD